MGRGTSRHLCGWLCALACTPCPRRDSCPGLPSVPLCPPWRCPIRDASRTVCWSVVHAGKFVSVDEHRVSSVRPPFSFTLFVRSALRTRRAVAALWGRPPCELTTLYLPARHLGCSGLKLLQQCCDGRSGPCVRVSPVLSLEAWKCSCRAPGCGRTRISQDGVAPSRWVVALHDSSPLTH